MKISFLKEAFSKFAKSIGIDKKKLFLLITLVLIIAYLDLRFVAAIQLKVISKTGPKIIRLQNDLKRIDVDLKKMRELKEKEGYSGRGAVSGAKKIISEDKVVLLMEQISSAANKYDVRVAQMRPQKEARAKGAKDAKKEKFTPLTITLDLVCAYHNLGRFLNELENAGIFLTAQEIRIDPQAADYLRQKASVVLRTYVRE
ncbi:MAG: hypothetical protein A3G38_00690 [Omnitrophica WOR_2 bacterium RIFCSPLOWO2_12_FULL_51_8]|nr:MAG: hypothetical protein A3G38_00690 [Omnitrophica WOR_2 bacterium RIFCSPLOWO2_12_FULL_51_8]